MTCMYICINICLKIANKKGNQINFENEDFSFGNSSYFGRLEIWLSIEIDSKGENNGGKSCLPQLV